MSKNKEDKRKKMKYKKVCSYSGKPIGNKSVVLEEFVVEYVRKLGYLVSNFKFLFGVFFVFLFAMTFVSALDPFAMDFGERSNMVFTFIFVLIGAFFVYLGSKNGVFFVFASMLFVILGLLMLFNSVNIILSFIIIAGGVALAFY